MAEKYLRIKVADDIQQHITSTNKYKSFQDALVEVYRSTQMEVTPKKVIEGLISNVEWRWIVQQGVYRVNHFSLKGTYDLFCNMAGRWDISEAEFEELIGKARLDLKKMGMEEVKLSEKDRLGMIQEEDGRIRYLSMEDQLKW